MACPAGAAWANTIWTSTSNRRKRIRIQTPAQIMAERWRRVLLVKTRNRQLNHNREYSPEYCCGWDSTLEPWLRELRKWLVRLGTGTLYLEPGSPWENGYCESFNGKLRDECLNGEIFYSLKEAQIVIEQWRVEYNTRRPHSALGYRPPVPAAYSPLVAANQLSQPQAVM